MQIEDGIKLPAGDWDENTLKEKDEWENLMIGVGLKCCGSEGQKLAAMAA